MLQRVATQPRDLGPYHAFVDAEVLGDLERLAARLRGLKVGHVNATSRGGGVAEILVSLVPLMTGLGVKTEWYCIDANRDFFEVTKNIHNSLQGGSWQFDSRTHETFLTQNRRIAAEIQELDVDLWVEQADCRRDPRARCGSLGGPRLATLSDQGRDTPISASHLALPH
jgi:trehalose synthase